MRHGRFSAFFWFLDFSCVGILSAAKHIRVHQREIAADPVFATAFAGQGGTLIVLQRSVLPE
jgi:hypothetical protein